jgi:hypothetical protein
MNFQPGDILQPDSIVITDEDYIDFVLQMTRDASNRVPIEVLYHLTRDTTLFVEYSLLDYNLRLLFKMLRWNVQNAARPPFYSVDPSPDRLIYDVWHIQTRHVIFLAQEFDWQTFRTEPVPFLFKIGGIITEMEFYLRHGPKRRRSQA